MRYAILTGAMLAAVPAACEGAPSGPESVAPLVNRSAADCTNVRGAIDAAFVSASDIEGTIFDETLGTGNASATVTELTAAGDGALHVRLEHEYAWQFEGGDGSILTEDQGVLSPIDPPLYRFNNRLEVVGGTGQLAGASGAIRAHGAVDLGSGQIDLAYHGRVCT